MKRFVILFITWMMLFACAAHAELGIDLTDLSPEELQQLISAAESQLQVADEAMMQTAIQTLVEHWKNEVYGDSIMEGSDGYLEILAAQVTYIRKDFALQTEFAPAAADMFQNVYCVVDFVLLSDYYATAPYYCDAGIDNCIVIYRDGTMEFSGIPLFLNYRARTFSNDFSAIIERVERYDVGENNIYYLVDR